MKRDRDLLPGKVTAYFMMGVVTGAALLAAMYPVGAAVVAMLGAYPAYKDLKDKGAPSVLRLAGGIIKDSVKVVMNDMFSRSRKVSAEGGVQAVVNSGVERVMDNVEGRVEKEINRARSARGDFNTGDYRLGLRYGRQKHPVNDPPLTEEYLARRGRPENNKPYSRRGR